MGGPVGGMAPPTGPGTTGVVHPASRIPSAFRDTANNNNDHEQHNSMGSNTLDSRSVANSQNVAPEMGMILSLLQQQQATQTQLLQQQAQLIQQQSEDRRRADDAIAELQRRADDDRRAAAAAAAKMQE